MICLICRRAEIVDRLTPVTLARGEFRLVVKNVPARVCPSCREAYVSEDVALQLLRDAEKMSRGDMLEVVSEYKALSLE
jgi:YgiT-type zinc finger domain-containing protein